ncbi:transglutaminase TgpA family protein [Saccharopolyspora sp. CA-218241]|uniref:transglutaminase TgpA family protein n=1 Tax=Saccharopolyspora sp. CA-218241 TaxID=3240027 RepID=UPI003D987CE7
MSARVDTSVVATGAGGLAVLCTATSFTGVLADLRWLLPATIVVALLGGIGIAGRKLNQHPVVVVLAQLVGLLLGLTALFTGSGVLGVLPGPAAIGELGAHLSGALEQVRAGVPPVPAEPALQCLLCLGVGLVAIAVDVIVVGMGAPAVAGLVLLCVFAVPASLAARLLPWWSFALGALGFALLLACGGQQRWQRREPGDRIAHTLFGRTTVGLASSAAVVALVSGVAFTGVGTEGRLPGSEADMAGGTSGIGLQPFTSLRGQLERDEVVELFRVRGLPDEAYLRALTLRRFNPEQGWRLEGLTQGVPAGPDLPPPEGTPPPAEPPARVEIRPVGYRDPWLPVFGVPTGVTGMGPSWRYDPAAGVVFTQTNQDSRPYTEELVLPDPSPEELRSATGSMPIAPEYLDASGIPPEVTALARRLTADADNDFDRAVAINRFFTDPANGFRYDLQTAPDTGISALSDFLFRGKRGFCEQYASSMAVLLRAVGVPSRVAIGFTAGYRDGDERVITTEDAHAWVEVYFPGHGWQTFDPTPLEDGRTALPGFLEADAGPAVPAPPPPPGQPQSQAPQPPTAGPAPEQPAQPDATRREPESGGSGVAWVIALGALAVVLLAAPAAVRAARRHLRLRAATSGGAGAAWREVLDEFQDRGSTPGRGETARGVATALAERHGLDQDATRSLRELVTAVERQWYGPPEPDTARDLSPAVSAVLAGIARSAPLTWRERLFPRSVLRPLRDG